MVDLHNPILEKVYSAKTDAAREAAYDDWAEGYEADLMRYGFRIPTVAAGVFARYVPADATPILDAGCGTGLQAEPLHLLGYGPIVGIDLSRGMLTMSERKGIYAELRQMALGETLDFADGFFAATLSMGCITPGHAPASAFDELIRVTRVGGQLIFSLRVDAGQEPEYPAAIAAHENSGAWKKLFQTPAFVSMPLGEPDVEHVIFVYERLV